MSPIFSQSIRASDPRLAVINYLFTLLWDVIYAFKYNNIIQMSLRSMCARRSSLGLGGLSRGLSRGLSGHRSPVAGVSFRSPGRLVRSQSQSSTSSGAESVDLFDGSGWRRPRATIGALSPVLSLALFLAANPAFADATPPTTAPPASSYYVSLGLFLLTLPGLWSLIKRSPKAKIKRKTFEVAGPADPTHMPLDTRARQIFNYFKNYNYTVKETGDVIVFEGNYRASVGQAAALVLYTAISLASTALVLSIAAPFGGNWWYLMTLISPAAGAYYFKNAERIEEFKVKMSTSDDDKTTDITVQGDDEEIDRFRKELDLLEKGMVRVKGILES